MESLKILVIPVHDVIGTGLWNDLVQSVDIVDCPVGYVDERRNRTAQVDQRMQFYSRLCPAELCPREKFQAEVDGRRIQRVKRLREVGNSCVLAIKFPEPRQSAVGRSRQRLANPVARSHRPRSYARRCREFPGGRAWRELPADRTRCPAGSPGRSIGRRPCTKTDPDRRKFAMAVDPDIASHINGDPARATGP